VERELAAYTSLRGARVLATLPSPIEVGYRNRARMAVGLSRHGRVDLGYFRAGTREIVDAPDCGVLVPALLDTTRRIRNFLVRAHDVPRELRHIDLRCGTDPSRQHLILVFRAERTPRFPLDALRRALPAVDGVSFHLNPDAGPQVLRGPIRHAWGRREVWVRHAGLDLRVSPGSFFQVNLAMLPAIHAAMDAALPGGDQLVDLYAGVGTHGLALGERYRRVTFVEGTRSAVADLKATARAAGRDVEVVPRAVERSLRVLAERRPDAVILNPSRAGARSAVLDAIGGGRARHVVYLSCEPETLARDLDRLAGHGLETITVLPIDMMPQTDQVEALAVLRAAPRTGRRSRPRRPLR
jgi:23S rRNA (uracil1939-C5)-methyltransferase